MAVVDLNSDLGEGFGSYSLGMDQEILPYVTSINLACGWHAGDPMIMDKRVKLAKKVGVSVGSHPGYPDLLGFGRRQLSLSPEEARTYMLYQSGALMAFLHGQGERLQHVKLHGAFYNQACADQDLAQGIIQGMKELGKDVILLALSGSYLAREAKNRGVRVCEEVFADRGYHADGSLVHRSHPQAFVKDPSVAIPRVIKMVKEGRVISIEGEEISLQADSICVHGDNPKALEFVSSLRKGLEDAGVSVLPMKEFIR